MYMIMTLFATNLMACNTTTGEQVHETSTTIVKPAAYYSAAVASPPQAYSVFYQQPSAPGKYGAAFNKVASIWLEALLIFSGAASLIGSGIAFRYYSYYSELGIGLWCGSMFIAAGAVGIAAGIHGTDSLRKGATASGVLSVAFATAQLTMAALGLCHDEDGYSNGEQRKSYALAGNGLLTSAAIFVIFIGVWLFAIGCSALCCFKNQAEMLSVPLQYVVQQPQQQLTASNHQPPIGVLRVITQINEQSHESKTDAGRKDD